MLNEHRFNALCERAFLSRSSTAWAMLWNIVDCSDDCRLWRNMAAIAGLPSDAITINSMLSLEWASKESQQ